MEEVQDTMDIDAPIDEELAEYRSDIEEDADEVSEQVKIVLQDGDKADKIEQIDDDKLQNLYQSLGIPLDEATKKQPNWRLDVIHIRGVQEMNTNDVLAYFNDYEPDYIEWVNDLSCNVLFSNAHAAATALEGLSVALILHNSSDLPDEISPGIEIIDASSLEISVPPYRWRLGKAHEKAKYLLLRFATNSDRKMPGARKHSQYYQKYGIPDPAEVNEKVKPTPRLTIGTNKFKRNLTRMVENDDLVDVKNLPVSMRMRADEEEDRMRSSSRTLDERLGASIRRRVGIQRRSKPSIWDRLEGGRVSGGGSSLASSGRIQRTVKLSNRGLRVFSRLDRSPRVHKRYSN